MNIFDGLKASVEAIKALLPDVVPFLRARQRRFRYPSKLGAPPPGHRLAWMLDGAEATLADPSEIHVIQAAELSIVAEEFAYWSGTPEWPSIASSVRDVNGFPHLMMCMAAAGMHARAGCRMVAAGPPTRRPDLVLYPDDNPIRIEVKVPERLQCPDAQLDDEFAFKLVSDRFKRADTKDSGQLAPDASAMLLIGGFHLSKGERAALVTAARRYFKEKGERRRHIAGVLFVTFGVLVDTIIVDGTKLKGPPGNSFKAFASSLFAENPFYSGVRRFRLADEDPELANAVEIPDPAVSR